ncbi:thymidine kinase [bacterium]|nr:thymidine kinase [bacterium]
MAKLYFRYGAMGASKTANALMVAYNYKERGQRALIFKPETDTREEKNIIKSRVGLSEEAQLISKRDNLLDFVDSEKGKSQKVDCVIVDEAQFLTKQQVEQLTDVVDRRNIPVIAYGLRADFRGELFEGSLWLLALADTIEEIKTVCFCSKKAIMNARILDGKVIKTGEQIKIGGNESYVALCRKHWKEGKTKPSDQ